MVLNRPKQPTLQSLLINDYVDKFIPIWADQTLETAQTMFLDNTDSRRYNEFEVELRMKSGYSIMVVCSFTVSLTIHTHREDIEAFGRFEPDVCVHKIHSVHIMKNWEKELNASDQPTATLESTLDHAIIEYIKS